MFVATRTLALYPSIQQYHSNRDPQELQCHLVAALVLLFDNWVIEVSAGSHPTLESALTISTEWSKLVEQRRATYMGHIMERLSVFLAFQASHEALAGLGAFVLGREQSEGNGN